MATSGTITYSLTARGVVTHALRRIRVTPVFDDPSAEDMAMGIAELNLMLKGWQLTGPHLWRQTEGSVTLLANTASYVLSPRPHRISECRYRDANSRDLPMEELTRVEYFEMPLKTTAGIPTQYYMDPQRSSATLYIWPVLSAVTTETIKYTYSRVFEDVASADEDLDIPQEWLDVVSLALADRLQGFYGKSDDRLTARAQASVATAKAMDREDHVRFVPDMRR